MATTIFRQSKWNLSGLVKDGKDLEARMKDVEIRVGEFEKNKGKLRANMTRERFLWGIGSLERIKEDRSIIENYARLKYDEDTQSEEASALLNSINRWGAQMTNRVLFASQWWEKEVDDGNASRLAGYSLELHDKLMYYRDSAKYSLSEPEEKVINTLEVSGIDALQKLYLKITNGFEYTIAVGGKEERLNEEQISKYFSDYSKPVRESAYNEVLSKYKQNNAVLGEIYQSVVTNNVDESVGMRKYPAPISAENFSNNIDDETVEKMLFACRENGSVFREFFEEKSKILGYPIDRYDIKCGIAEGGTEKFPFESTVGTILETFDRFNPAMAKYAKRVFSEGHIDSVSRKGKVSGAFCYSITPKITPYILIEYGNMRQDASTLAHELGHAVHAIAASGRSIINMEEAVPLAETASMFAEMLLMDKMICSASGEGKIAMLNENLVELYLNIQRQAYFTLFEIEAHRMVPEGATVEDLNKLYLDNLREQFGAAVKVPDAFQVEWNLIPHIYSTPFYCYSYSFGNLLALSMLQRYKKEGSSFSNDYMDILAAGGSTKPEKLLGEYGIDLHSSGLWREGFGYIKENVAMLKRM
ncbi:MAG: oligoendopeptidase F [Candidatus Micrarchaeota archaeon]|nr:oligoendopeptidase F [Candidatus Micrarchaeota archaeon]MDE1847596.1 oligoendopeptidase F [Candidatus Micrarchaeota archaeon]MDE1863799.1 oligoendopeptidase F [Candidatus Micrarchaeota archaeon]